MQSENQIVAGIIVNKDGELLLQLRDNKKEIRSPGMWSFPGGHKELNESIEKALFREILEETNLVFDSAIYLCTINDFSEGKVPYLIHFWILKYQSNQKYDCLEGVMLKFWSVNSIPGIHTPNYIKNVLQIYNEMESFIP
jgi:8-oxo-dGTP pyrophosphatase MutT (NUDIX family)